MFLKLSSVIQSGVPLDLSAFAVPDSETMKPKIVFAKSTNPNSGNAIASPKGLV